MMCKDEVPDLFKRLSGAARLDLMVTLLDSCMPFEIRFLSTVMENLGRRDFHELRDADHRANNFLHAARNGTMTGKEALCSALADAPLQLSSPCSNVNYPHTGPPPSAIYNNTVSNSQHATTPSDVSSSTTSTNQYADKIIGMRLSAGTNCQPSQLPDGHQFQSGRQQQGGGDGGGDSSSNNKCNMTLNLQNSENKDEKSEKKIILLDTIIRRRIILYLCVLQTTNRECANVYYEVLSELEPLIKHRPGWIEGLDDKFLEELALLFTISSNHPAFTFEQRHTMNKHGILFRATLSKSEPPKVTPATQYITTAVQGLDPKYNQYCIQYLPHPVSTMQWQNLSATNGTAEEGGGNRLQNPVTFTMPPSFAFPMFMQTHPHHPRSQGHQVNPHQFPQNPPLQPSLSPQAQMGMTNPNHPHPSQLHSFQQNPFGTATVGSHLQPQPSHAYTQSMNGPVQSILPVPSGIHAQLQAVGLQNPIPPIISSSVSLQPQYQQQQQTKAQQNPSQLSPQLPPQPSVIIGGGRNNNNVMSTTTATVGNPISSSNGGSVVVPTAIFPSQSNSLDGNESEEWDSTESSPPYQSPSESLTPSRSQSPSQPNQAHVITNQNQCVNVQVAPHLSQPPDIMSHINSTSSSNSSSNAVPATTSVTYSSTSSQRSVCSSATSISPPPRSQKTSSQKLSQNIQVQTRIPKNAQDIEVKMASLNNVPFSSVPVSTPLVNSMAGKSMNCVVSANNLNGIKPSTLPDRRSKSSPVTNLMNSCNLNTSPIVVTTPSSSSSSTLVSQCPGLIQTTVPPSTSCTSSYSTNASSVSNQSQQSSTRRQQQPPTVRRQPANNVTAQPHHPPLPTSTSNHYNLHSQPMKTTSATNFHSFTFPFSIPQYPSHQQQPPPPSIPTSKSMNNTTLTAATQISKQITPSCNQNGGKMNISANDISLFGGHSCSQQQQPNSHIHNGIKLGNNDCATTFNMPVGLISSCTPQLPNTSMVPPLTSQTRSRGVLLEVGGGQEVLGRIDATSFFGPLEDLVESGNRIKISCYNCGAHNHYGPDCKENTMEEMTRNPYRINFLREPLPQETKDTD